MLKLIFLPTYRKILHNRGFNWKLYILVRDSTETFLFLVFKELIVLVLRNMLQLLIHPEVQTFFSAKNGVNSFMTVSIESFINAKSGWGKNYPIHCFRRFPKSLGLLTTILTFVLPRYSKSVSP